MSDFMEKCMDFVMLYLVIPFFISLFVFITSLMVYGIYLIIFHSVPANYKYCQNHNGVKQISSSRSHISVLCNDDTIE